MSYDVCFTVSLSVCVLYVLYDDELMKYILLLIST